MDCGQNFQLSGKELVCGSIICDPPMNGNVLRIFKFDLVNTNCQLPSEKVRY